MHFASTVALRLPQLHILRMSGLPPPKVLDATSHILQVRRVPAMYHLHAMFREQQPYCNLLSCVIAPDSMHRCEQTALTVQ